MISRPTVAPTHLLLRAPAGSRSKFLATLACGAPNIAGTFATLSLSLVTCSLCRTSAEKSAVAA